MSYLVSNYRHLFPLGTFDAPQRITTWNESHRLFAQNQIKQKKSQEELASGGLILKKGHIDFGREGFFNYQCYEIDPKKRKLRILFFNSGEFPIRVFRATQDLLLCSTLGYFYFTTNPQKDEVPPPKIRVNNLFIHQGKLYQLPVVDRSALVIYKDGTVKIPFVEAHGTFNIGSEKFNWRGARTLKKNSLPEKEIVVYTASAGEIKPYKDPTIGPGRLAKKVLTPRGNFLDLIINSQREKLVVSQIKKGGGTEVTLGQMILSGPKGLFKGIKKGDLLRDFLIKGPKRAPVLEAVSIGPRIFKSQKERIRQLVAEGLDDDQALCNDPHREGLKLARSYLVLLKNGKLVCILIDGIPQAGNIYPGVTPQEAADFIFKEYPQASQVVAIDPGGTMKAVYRDREGKTVVFGNLHYLKYKYLKDGTLKFSPDGYNGRKAVTFLGVF